MASLSPARATARALVSERRRRAGRMRDLARSDRRMAELSAVDRALALRLALGVTSAEGLLDRLIDERVRRASALDPRVRDALRVACFELCYLNTPQAAAVSQGVELVRALAPRAAGLANAVLRRVAAEARPCVDEAQAQLAAGSASLDDLVLVSALPEALVRRVADERGRAFAASLCEAQLRQAPVYVGAQGLRHDEAWLAQALDRAGAGATPVAGLAGAFAVTDAAALQASGLLERCDAVVADRSAQLVCRLVAPDAGAAVLEVGQGRATKSILLAAGVGLPRIARLVGIDSVSFKTKVARRRLHAAGLDGVAQALALDACLLAGPTLPPALDQAFGLVFVDAPCSGSGTMRRHAETAWSLTPQDVTSLAALQLRMLRAASARVGRGGMLAYATCSVLREEDEDVVAAFLASAEGAGFALRRVVEAAACAQDDRLREAVLAAQTPEGFLLTVPQAHGGDGHFCALLERVD